MLYGLTQLSWAGQDWVQREEVLCFVSHSSSLCDTVVSGPAFKNIPCGPNVVLGMRDSPELSHAKINLGIPLTELRSAACAIFNCPEPLCRSRLTCGSQESSVGPLHPAVPGVACWGVGFALPMVAREMQISSEGLVYICRINFKDLILLSICVCVYTCMQMYIHLQRLDSFHITLLAVVNCSAVLATELRPPGRAASVLNL